MMKRLFKGGTVVSGEGLKKIDLLVKGEKILAAGKNLEFQDAETIDVRGKLLFPGFIDAHTHMAAKFNDITAGRRNDVHHRFCRAEERKKSERSD